MDTKITTLNEMYLAGMSFYGDPFSSHGAWTGENEIGRVWSRFMGFMNENSGKIQAITHQGVHYEIHTYNDETISKGLFEVFVGDRLKSLEGVPPELVIKSLPASEYAVFTLQGEEISADWYSAAEKWIEEEGYQRCHPYIFQYYDERFKGVDRIDESILDVYIPVSPTA